MIERRSYTKLEGLSSEEKKERIRIQKYKSKQRAKERLYCLENSLPIIPKRLVNEGKTKEEVKQRKSELNRINKLEAKERKNNAT